MKDLDQIGDKFAPGYLSYSTDESVEKPALARRSADEKKRHGDMLTVLKKTADGGGFDGSTLTLYAPTLEAPRATPEQQEAMVSALIGDAAKEIIDLSNRMIKLNDQQRKELNKKVEDASKAAKEALAAAQDLAGPANVIKWIKSVGALIGSLAFVVISGIASGGLAVAGTLITFGFALTDFIKTCIDATPAEKLPDGTDKKKIDFSLNGLIECIVEQIDKDNPGLYKSDVEKKQAIQAWSTGLTVALVVVSVAMGIGATGMAVQAAKAGEKLAQITGTGLMAGAKVMAGTAEMTAGVAAIVDGRNKLELADFSEKAEKARADGQMQMALLEGVRMNIQTFVEVFTHAVKMRDASIEMTSNNIAEADRTRIAVIRHYS